MRVFDRFGQLVRALVLLWIVASLGLAFGGLHGNPAPQPRKASPRPEIVSTPYTPPPVP